MSDATQSEQTPMNLPKPGDEHAQLKPFEGTFRAEVKMWMGPGEPMISIGTLKNSWKLGGLFLHQDYQGDAGDGPFPAFCGEGFWGYNTTTNHYEGFWIDVASTTMQMETGDVDAEGKIWTMYSEVTHPHTGKLLQRRSVITLIDQDHNRMEMYFKGPDGNEMKTMEINYTRA